MNDDTLIWIVLFLLASSPFILAVALRRFLSISWRRLICHVLSGVLLVWLSATYILAIRAYRLAGYDDGSSGMAGFLLLAGALVTIPANLLLYLPWRRRKKP